MKYHRGRYIEGQWIFGGICRETKACFLVQVERRDKDTLLPIIRTRILPGTRVMSDMRKAYDCLQDEGYVHLTVNHSLNFVDPDTGAHTQGIENRWWCVKRGLPVQERPRNSSKATYRSICGVSTMERILLATLSSTLPTFMRSVCVLTFPICDGHPRQPRELKLAKIVTNRESKGTDSK